MAFFRFHRGSLSESLKTTVIVKDIEELRKVICDSWFPWLENEEIKNYPDFSIKIEIPYGLPLAESFDARCSWYQHYVSVDIMKKGRFDITGYLSEPLWNYQIR